MNSEFLFPAVFEDRISKVNQFVDSYFDHVKTHEHPASEQLKSAIKYSISSGGKRFRPLLALVVGELFNTSEDRLLPWAVAVEFIHTYSLIHDDLPCMDDDDFRRGQPTNHKVYGEALALLAGDALLTESFFLVSEAYSDQPELARRLVSLLSHASGLRGMIGGQVMDLYAEKNKLSFDELLTVHRLKTAEMIQVPLQGAGWICGIEESKIDVLRKFGEVLGLAFQVADDILDHNKKGEDNRSFTQLIGYSEAKSLLVELSEEALFHLQKLPVSSDLLHRMIEYNLIRRG